MAREVDFIEIVAKASGQDQIKQVNDIVHELMKRAEESGTSVDDLADRLKDLGRAAGNTSPYNDFIDKMKQMATVTAVGMGIKKAATKFISFDDVMRRVQATTGATSREMELMRYQSEKLGKTTSWSATEAGQAQLEFSKAGFSVNETLAATGGILNTAIAGELGLAEASSITAGALRIFNLSADKANMVGDMLAKTASSTSTDIAGLAESLKYSGNGAKQFGLSLQDTLGILGQLGNMSLKGSQAGTSLQAMFSSLMNKQKGKMLFDIGVQLTEDGSFRNLLDIIDDIKDKTKDMSNSQRQSFIANVFGDQGAQAMNRLLAAPREELHALIGEIENSQGFSKSFAETLEGGLGGATRGLSSATEGFAIKLTEVLCPALELGVNAVTEVISAGTGFLEWLDSGSALANILEVAIVGLAAGYGTYKAMLIGAVAWEKLMAIAHGVTAIAAGGFNAVLGISNVVLGLFTGTTSLATIGTWALNGALAILGSPIAIVVGAIAGLIAGFTVLYKKSEGFRNAISPLINALKSLWEWIKKFPLVGAVIDTASDIVDTVKSAVGLGDNDKKEKEIEEVTERVQAGTGDSKAFDAGVGENTDYQLFSGQSSSRSSGSQQYRHNGYYLKGSSVNSGAKSNQGVYTGEGSPGSKKIEKTPEEKNIDTLLSIKSLLTSILNILNTSKEKGSSGENNVSLTINKNENADLLQVVNDLLVAIGNR